MVMWLQTYEVIGHGPFPMDMLRYDNSWPQSSEDAFRMVHEEYDVDRRIRLSRYAQNKMDQPTYDRWKSFGWTVGEFTQRAA